MIGWKIFVIQDNWWFCACNKNFLRVHFSNFAYDWEIRAQLRSRGPLRQEWLRSEPLRPRFARFSCSWALRHFRKHNRYLETSFERRWDLKTLRWVSQNLKAAAQARMGTFSSAELGFRLQLHQKLLTNNFRSFYSVLVFQNTKNRAKRGRRGSEPNHSCRRGHRDLNWALISQSSKSVCKVRKMHS